MKHKHTGFYVKQQKRKVYLLIYDILRYFSYSEQMMQKVASNPYITPKSPECYEIYFSCFLHVRFMVIQRMHRQ